MGEGEGGGGVVDGGSPVRSIGVVEEVEEVVEGLVIQAGLLSMVGRLRGLEKGVPLRRMEVGLVCAVMGEAEGAGVPLEGVAVG